MVFPFLGKIGAKNADAYLIAVAKRHEQKSLPFGKAFNFAEGI